MDAVNEAVKLLRKRREEAVSEVALLNAEVRKIDAALDALSAAPSRVDAGEPAAARPDLVVRNRDGQIAVVEVKAATVPADAISMKEHAIAVLESEIRPWTIDELAAAIEQRGGKGDRSDKQFRGTIRTALWTLRNEGRVQRVGSKQNVATKYAEALALTDPDSQDLLSSDSDDRDSEAVEVSTS